MAAVFIDTLSAPDRISSVASATVLIPPPTDMGTNTLSAVAETKSLIEFLLYRLATIS